MHQLFCFLGAALYETMIIVESQVHAAKASRSKRMGALLLHQASQINRSPKGNAIGLNLTALFEEGS
jgi:hypothetical protein